MPLHPGTRLGPYDAVALIGVGGMGEVYRARDTKLNRDVAIKVLLDLVANDPERPARFHREAQVLASLNHPNIAHIYGVEESGGVHALIMELIEGPTLAERLARPEDRALHLSEGRTRRRSEGRTRHPSEDRARRPSEGRTRHPSEDRARRASGVGAAPSGRPIPPAEALPIAKQIVDALEAAREQGIVHRARKRANVKVREDGTVKVLDFGLAKLTDPAEAGHYVRDGVGTGLQTGRNLTLSSTKSLEERDD